MITEGQVAKLSLMLSNMAIRDLEYVNSNTVRLNLGSPRGDRIAIEISAVNNLELTLMWERGS